MLSVTVICWLGIGMNFATPKEWRVVEVAVPPNALHVGGTSPKVASIELERQFKDDEQVTIPKDCAVRSKSKYTK